jgi:catechol 2,3-dioxygenase-like lactoylglutathione lyase family enzyme
MKETLGIKHIALKVKNFKDCLNFYTNLLEMKIDWQPDGENAYLTNGRDNLALHLDETLDLITIYKKVQDHRDGSRSFYCYDPDLNIVQFLWHPHLNK